MEKPKTIFFYDRCRLCLENPGADDIFSNTDLVQDIFLCTGVKVTSQENLQHKICTECLEIVVKAKKLRILATANDIHLKSLFDDDDDDNKLVIDETDLTCSEERSPLQKDCTNIDSSIKKEIVENDSAVKERSKLKKRKTSVSSECSNSKEKKLSVRRDLFNSTETVTSSTKDVSPTKRSSKAKVKKIKIESEESLDSLDYVCEVCKKEFTAWKKFYLHQKTHNKNILCPLDTCGKKFAIKGDLEKHIRTHTGERPFRCEICNKGFAQRGTLKAHRDTVHAEDAREFILT